MEDINNGKIMELEEIGTRKYIITINNRWLVGFKEIEKSEGKGGYSNGTFTDLTAIPPKDIILTSYEREDAMVIDGRINLKSIMTKLLSDWGYKFYQIEIIEKGD